MLYHVKVYWDDHCQRLVDALCELDLPLHYSEHAMTRHHNSPNRRIQNIPKRILWDGIDEFELEVRDSQLVKLCFRYPIGDGWVICIAGHHDTDEGTFFVRGFWLNREDDDHVTLNESRYARSPFHP